MPNKQKAVLVTGAAGFIGYHMVKKLLATGETVVGFDSLNDYYDVNLKEDRVRNLGIDSSRFNNLEIHSHGNFTFFKGQLEDDAVWELIKRKFEITSVIHLAAQAGVRYSLDQPKKYISANVLGFLQVLEFCRELGLKKLIYASSSSVYGMESQQPFTETEPCNKPVSLYAATKRTNELMAYTYGHLYGLESIGLRFFTVYGPWGRPDMAPFLFAKAAFDRKPIQVFNYGEQSRDFTYVDDIVNGVFQVYQQQNKIKGAMVCNIGNGSPVGLMDFIKAIENASGILFEKELMPEQAGDVAQTYADTSVLQKNFGYSPQTDIKTGIEAFVAWYADYYNHAVASKTT